MLGYACVIFLLVWTCPLNINHGCCYLYYCFLHASVDWLDIVGEAVEGNTHFLQRMRQLHMIIFTALFLGEFLQTKK